MIVPVGQKIYTLKFNSPTYYSPKFNEQVSVYTPRFNSLGKLTSIIYDGGASQREDLHITFDGGEA